MTGGGPGAGEAPDAAGLAALADDFRVLRARALRGPNAWSRQPVIQADVDVGMLAQHSPADAATILARLQGELPSLDLAVLDAPAVDATRTHAPGTWWGTLLVRVALELAHLAGDAAGHGRVVLSAPDATRLGIALSYEYERTAIEAVRGAARVIRDALRGEAAGVPELLAELRAERDAERPADALAAVMREAERRGIPVRRSLESGDVQLGLGRHQRRIGMSGTDRTSVLATELVRDTTRLREVLAGVGVPVPPLDGDDPHAGAPGAASAPASVHAVLVVDGRVVMQRDDAIHSELRALCELAAGAVGLDVAVMDVACADLRLSPRSSGAVVTAIRAGLPELATAGGAMAGAHAAAVRAIVDMLFPVGAEVTVPVLAITGTNGKTTTTRLIAHLMRQTLRTVGFTTTDGVYLREQLLMTGDLTGPFAANVILSHREVEVAVLETARGGILKSGLGFAECDVAVVMNVTPDHLGLRGIETVEQLAAVKAVLPSVVVPRGTAVLNADDPLVYAMREVTPGRVALFSTQPAGARPRVDEHLRHGGMAAVVDAIDGREHLRLLEGERVIELGTGADLPLTFGGLARFQLQNILAASLAAYAAGVAPDDIRRGLASFHPSADVTPGRLNLLKTPRGTVLLDYAHNAAAVAGLLDFVRAMPARRRMALLSAPGDRRDEDLREIGRLASGLDFVIMKEHDVYRRGRDPGVIAEIMADGLRATGFPEARLRTFAEEHDAVAHVMTMMEPGDVVIIIADDTRAVAAQLAAM